MQIRQELAKFDHNFIRWTVNPHVKSNTLEYNYLERSENIPTNYKIWVTVARRVVKIRVRAKFARYPIVNNLS